MVDDIFLLKRRSRTGPVSPVSCRCNAGSGTHGTVITGIPRAGVNALIEMDNASSRAAVPSGCSATARSCRTFYLGVASNSAMCLSS
jgi:hypothetical protein